MPTANAKIDKSATMTTAQRQKLSRLRRRMHQQQRRLEIWVNIHIHAVVLPGLCHVTGHKRAKIIEDALKMYWESKDSPFLTLDGELFIPPDERRKMKHKKDLESSKKASQLPSE